MLDQRKIRLAFNRAAKTYNDHALIQNEIAERLLNRLDYIRLQPATILDCGARTGYVTQQLAIRYPQAQIISIECAEKMLKQGLPGWKFSMPVCAMQHQLPLQENSFDLIISNLVLHWVDDYRQYLWNLQKLLRPGGLLLFSTLGIDSLIELYSSFTEVSAHMHVHPFYDMHPIGDALLAQYWVNPVMDNEIITFNYSSVIQLIHDLKATGVTNALTNRALGLMGKNRWQRMQEYYYQFFDPDSQRLPVTIEAIFGHAWRISEQEYHQYLSKEFTFPLSSLKR